MKRKFRVSFNGFHIDNDHGVFHEGRKLTLYPKELAVLALLVQRADELVSKEELIEVVWNGAPTSDESIARCVSVIKSRLREASPGTDALIKTEYGRGYRFVGKVSSGKSWFCEESFLTLIDAFSDLIALKDGNGRWLVLNQAGIDLYGLAGQPWQYKTDTELAALASPGNLEGFRTGSASDEIAWQTRQPSYSTKKVYARDGRVRILEVVKSPLFNEDGSRKSLVILGRDVTGKAAAGEHREFPDGTCGNGHEAVMITDADNNILSVNRFFTEVTGYTAEEVIGRNPRILSSSRHCKKFYQAMWHRLRTEGSWHGQIRACRKDGKIYPKWLDIGTMHDQDGKPTHYIATFSDITQRKATEEQLEFMAYHDPLTRLPNRLLLRDRLEQAVAAATREGTLVALLFLDLDQFKSVNDTLGHETGDRLLQDVAERLGNCVRDTDTISRLGGDEFVILLTDLQNVDTITPVAHKILGHLANPFAIRDRVLNISASIGISLYPNDGANAETLLKLADAAMYHAKDCGRNTYRFYTERLNVHALERTQLQNSLHHALKHHEFVLHYQPQFELASGQMIGVEALIRWNSPELGLVPPSKFISVAEDSGLIVSIGEWVLREACRQNRAWQDAGLEPFVVAVNLSALQFRRSGIVGTVVNILDESGLEPAWLELELTETLLIHDIEYVLEIVKKLKKIGVRLSIDDFGTGYSSLAHLKRFAVDKLKVAQSFVCNLTADSDDAAIVRSVIHLGHSLNLKVIAESVETQEQAEYLEHQGCDEVQGHFYSRPLPAKEVTWFIQKAGKPGKPTG
ncbi:MAG TPA: EAL domain-containing protein [Novimethylophilus sp.]|uniref:EAL domain-containing protein n=1 Tax=Novimethylophilus sp. TaxID=2137426 RepID=UPI002F419CB8